LAQAGIERAVGAEGGRNGAWTFQSTFGFGVGGQECPPSVVRRGVFQEVWPFVVRQMRGTERGFSNPRRPNANARNVLGVCDMRAKGPESYQPGPTAQVPVRSHFRRAEGPSHRSGMGRPYRASGICVFDDLGRWPRLVWSAPLALEAGGTERGLSSPRLDSGLVDRNVHPPLSAGAWSKRSVLLSFAK